MPLPVNMAAQAKRLERDVARDLQARRVFLSGAGAEKADIRKAPRFAAGERSAQLTFRVEAKATASPTYQFTVRDWADLVRVADPAGEIPLFVIRFFREFGQQQSVLLRDGFAEELGLPVSPKNFEQIDKTHRVAADQSEYFGFMNGRRAERLVLSRYDSFLAALRSHEQFES